MEELRALMQRYFNNVFMFGMNDEVLHTGYRADVPLHLVAGRRRAAVTGR